MSHTAAAVDVFSAAADAPQNAVPQWPVLRDQTQSALGLYGGIASAYAINGLLESATLLILPTGYAAPLLSNGSLATFPVTYFDQPGCGGREYLPASGDHPGLLPFPGVVYRSPASGQPAYIPQGRAPAPVQVKSSLRLDAQAGIVCEVLDKTLPLLAAEPNAPAITGMNRTGEVGSVSIGVETATAARQKRDRRLEGPAAATAGNEPAMPEAPQQECSPGCLDEAVGNGSCDIACYFEACRFDGGDCAAMNKDELDKALANMCSPGCNREDIGDGFCDTACRTEACSQDGGDCAQQQTEIGQ